MIPSLSHFLTGTRIAVGSGAGFVGSMVVTLANVIMTAVGNLTVFSWTGGQVLDFAFSGSAIAGMKLQRAGGVAESDANLGNYTGDDEWIEGGGSTIGDDYEARWTLDSGDDLTPTDWVINTWTTISSDRQLDLIRSTPGSSNSVAKIEIREIAVPANIETATVNFGAEFGT